jgi:hypothetical protein
MSIYKKILSSLLKNHHIMRRVLFFALSLFVVANLFSANKSRPIASIPFEMVGTYVVVKVKINDSSSLNLILDSGVRNTIITELQPGDRITLNYSDVKDMLGLGGGDHLEAYTSNFNTLKIGKLKLDPKTVYVLKEDIFNLSKHTGTKINGLIGVDIFYDHVVEINYSSQRVNFYNNQSFIVPKGFEKMPLSVEARKMFIQLSVLQSDSSRRDAKMLIDTGAELNAWFQTYKDQSVQLPANGIKCTIGQGLNGEIKGKIGRIPQICFGSFCFDKPIVSFPDSASISEIVGNSNRDGTIGSQLLSRFNYYIDYGNKQFYFKPNANFKNRFNYNVAGIEVLQIVPYLPIKEIWRVWADSPAAKVGVQNGDQVIEINGEKAFELSVNEIRHIFETASKYPLKLRLMRNGKEIYVKIDMKSKI